MMDLSHLHKLISISNTLKSYESNLSEQGLKNVGQTPVEDVGSEGQNEQAIQPA